MAENQRSMLAKIANLDGTEVESIKELERKLSESSGTHISLIAYELEVEDWHP